MQEKITITVSESGLVEAHQVNAITRCFTLNGTEEEKIAIVLAQLTPLTDGEIELPDGTVIQGTFTAPIEESTPTG